MKHLLWFGLLLGCSYRHIYEGKVVAVEEGMRSTVVLSTGNSDELIHVCLGDGGSAAIPLIGKRVRIESTTSCTPCGSLVTIKEITP